ncbi:hypothetical protein N8K70_10485 [Microbacterium betulae]|uniref:Lipoprotein n=1 Tax=Microbacterium betulae TaxID=2981139 RepID=A0AA97I3T2_9MICO|nr:hypothetical protein [Microbacterium sp. AB]WOF21811.1 hypothetical protein N8K70_10485 [Microbacterium sp. AB]
MTTRRPFAVLPAALIAALALSGCTPDPGPTPTPTGFATEEEAFAAAEETYRAYIDALNARNAGDEEADPQSFLIGEVLESDQRTREILEQSKQTIQGSLDILSFTPETTTRIADAIQVDAIVCMDATNARILDSNGGDVTPEDTPSIYSLKIELTSADNTLKISASENSDNPC